MRKTWEEEQWRNKQRFLLVIPQQAASSYFCTLRIDDEIADKKLMTVKEIERKNACTIDLLRAKDANIQQVL